ncbi:DUF5719 family protein, partial [Kineosporia sp. A_224]|uniref:DUF5719 family protein n=1 Tax=Kineosporia sp. A_224 TaxID=1962180 RepID=UPI000B4AF0CE
TGRPPRPAPRHGALRAVPRVLALVAVVGLGAAALEAVQRWQPATTAAPAAQVLPVTASAAVPVCPGPEPLQAPEGGRAVAAPGPTVVGALVVPAGLVGADGAVSVGGTASARLSTMTRASDDAADADGTAAGTRFAAAKGAGVVRRTVALATTKAATALPLRVDADRAAGSAPVVAATQVTLASTGDLRGLSAVSCGVASTSSWLVGGGTQDGRRARLLLANPAPAPAVVGVAVLGPDGRVPTPSTQELVVPAGGQVSVLLDAVAPGLEALAVHVTTRSGRVAATLHDEVVRGLSPGGTDGVTGSRAPSKRQVVPGIDVAGDQAEDLPEDPTAPGAVAVRVAVPGTSDAIVRVRLLGPDGPVDLPRAVRTVPAGTVADLPVTGVKAGLYTAVVEADVPVVAAGLLGRASAEGSTSGGADGVPDVLPGDVATGDLAWVASASAVDGTSAVSTPEGAGVTTRLALGAVDAARVVVVPVARDGSPLKARTVDLAAGTTATVEIPAEVGGAVFRTLSGAVYPAIVLTASDRTGPLVAAAAVRTGGIVAPEDARSVVEDDRTGLR